MRGLHPDAVGVDVIGRHTAGLVELARGADMATPVDTCSPWHLADLVWHLTEVQGFWAHIVGNRPTGPETYDVPHRPSDAELPDALASACARLIEELGTADPADQAWSWADDHTVGFTIRRQTHEAVIHHIDGVLAVGASVPVLSPALAADGIDELVDVMVTGIPPWATFTPSIQVVRLAPDDDTARWTMSLGAVAGTSTQSGVTYDALPAADRVDDDVAADVEIGGSAGDLLLWLWGRAGDDALRLDGEIAVATALRDTVIAATQ